MSLSTRASVPEILTLTWERINFEDNTVFLKYFLYEQRLVMNRCGSTIRKLKFDDNISVILKNKFEGTKPELTDFVFKFDSPKSPQQYIENVVLRGLGAWNSTFEKKLKISEPLKAQGTLSSKIILSQYTALYKTMNSLSIDSIPRFPFVIDSPGTKEASKLSSKEILDLILNIEALPQTIIVTVDFRRIKRCYGKIIYIYPIKL